LEAHNSMNQTDHPSIQWHINKIVSIFCQIIT
jgi:hypothetical protein